MAFTKMFRQEALDRLRSPDDLNQLLTIVRRRAWISVLTLGCLCALGVVWSVYGNIPVTVDGFGVLINPGNVRGLQATAAGQIVELHVRAGHEVRTGQVIAVLNQEELHKELRQESDRLAELEAKHRIEQAIDAEGLAMELGAIEQQRKLILDEITESERLASQARDRHLAFLDEQRRNLEQTRELTTQLNQALRSKVEITKSLRIEGLTSDDLVLDAQSNYADSEVRLANLAVDFLGMDLRKIEGEQDQLLRQNRVSDLRLRLLDLEIAEKRQHQELTMKQSERDLEAHDTERRIDRIKFHLERSRSITSEYTGRVLELAVAPGQVIDSGTRIGTVELTDPHATLRNLAYFPVKDGKQIKHGDVVHVTPTNVQRERFGSIVGRVVKVSPFPITQEGATNALGNAEIASALMQRGGAIEVEVELERDPQSVSGFRWTSRGPPIELSAGTTSTVRVTIERRRPISYVLPVLRTWVLGEKDDKRPEF